MEHEWRGRKAGSYAWYEVQDPVEYWSEFSKPKMLIRRIEFYAEVAYDPDGYLLNDSALIVQTDSKPLLAILNSPLMWSFRFKTFPHKKDEALAMDIPFVSALPIPEAGSRFEDDASLQVSHLFPLQAALIEAKIAIHDWLRLEFGLDRPGRVLDTPERLDADAFAAAVRAALPRRRTLSAAEIARLKREHADTVAPARQAAADIQRLERRLSDLVNQAYGLTPEDVALLWATAPPRMPLSGPG